ncbi:hypothetical protein U9M48_044423 [Paspalum notatum var. saurae]|uniref:Uncharacterized protein n=1 Tax=Paspalum notatum var. saurae TaxID=547442 RepID=A0AAQ3XHH8_PASNO
MAAHATAPAPRRHPAMNAPVLHRPADERSCAPWRPRPADAPQRPAGIRRRTPSASTPGRRRRTPRPRETCPWPPAPYSRTRCRRPPPRRRPMAPCTPTQLGTHAEEEMIRGLRVRDVLIGTKAGGKRRALIYSSRSRQHRLDLGEVCFLIPRNHRCLRVTWHEKLLEFQ